MNLIYCSLVSIAVASSAWGADPDYPSWYPEELMKLRYGFKRPRSIDSYRQACVDRAIREGKNWAEAGAIADEKTEEFKSDRALLVWTQVAYAGKLFGFAPPPRPPLSPSAAKAFTLPSAAAAPSLPVMKPAGWAPAPLPPAESPKLSGEALHFVELAGFWVILTGVVVAGSVWAARRRRKAQVA